MSWSPPWRVEHDEAGPVMLERIGGTIDHLPVGEPAQFDGADGTRWPVSVHHPLVIGYAA